MAVWRSAAQSLTSSLLFSLSLFAAHDLLRPLFGSTAIQFLTTTTSSSILVLLFLVPYEHKVPQVAVVCIYSIFPLALHMLATLATRVGDLTAAAALSLVPVLLPAAFVTISSCKETMLLLQTPKNWTLKSLAGIALATTVSKLQQAWAFLPFNSTFNPSVLLVLLSWTLITLDEARLSKPGRSPASRKRPKSKVKKYILPSICTAITLAFPPTRPRSLPYIHPNGLLRILSSTMSVTGRIVVGEELKHGLRFMRADHSILGGVWIGPQRIRMSDPSIEPVRDANGVPLGDSIYSAFVLQEAARLQEKAEPAQNALIIGLGTGIAAQAFIQHGLLTTVIEIDPAVYAAARKYFGLPQPAAAYLEDARGWVERRAAAQNETYDIVVHDCFSGGGVPEFLFTTEFWGELKKIVSPHGIVAVNYAGLIDSDSTRAVYSTLKQSFGQCRVFQDYYEQDVSEEKLVSIFINLVFFCTPSSSPLRFRQSVAGDHLGSYLREHVLSTLPLREVPERLIFGNQNAKGREAWILTDARNPLGQWQGDGAKEHWKVMRQVLSDFVWFTY